MIATAIIVFVNVEFRNLTFPNHLQLLFLMLWKIKLDLEETRAMQISFQQSILTTSILS